MTTTTMTPAPTRRAPRTLRSALPLLAALALAACSDSTTPAGFTTDELTAELAVTPDHFHTLETEGRFTVAVTDPAGEPVTDFELLRLERQRVGESGWSATDLALEGEHYVGTHVFEASGAYRLRVAGLRASDDEMVVLLELPATLEVVRAHADLGGRRVEVETFPGHIHAGDQATVTFWVMAPEADAGGPRPPVPGLAPTIAVELNGVRSTYAAAEAQPGVYTAVHRFAAVGAARLGIRFRGSDGQEHEWSAVTQVHAPH